MENKTESKLNVLQLLSSLEIGGLEKLMVEFVKSAKDVNYTVVIMNTSVNENLKQELLSSGCEVHFLQRPQSHKHPKYLFQLLAIIRKNNIKIVHTHSSGSKMWSILCKIFNPKLKLVYTIHDSVIIKGLSGLKLFVHKFFIDTNIAISGEILNECKNKKVKKPVLVYNGIKLENFAPNHEKQYDFKPLKIINIARITYQKKGQDVLIKALGECKKQGLDFICNFVGGVYDYDKESFEHLKKLISELNLEANVNFLGSRNDISKLLSESDLFVLPSRFEGLPMSLLEAMASGLAVIASNISGSNDLIKNEENGLLFENENHQELARKITELYNNREKMQHLAKSGLKFVQDFDISKMCHNYHKVYKTLIGEKYV